MAKQFKILSENKLDRRKEQLFLRYMRLKMWIENPHCEYCGVETIIPDSSTVPKGQPTPPNIATIDHKYSRYNPAREKEEQEYLLCCSLCNNYKAQLEEDKIPIEELRLRSQRPSHRTIMDAKKENIPSLVS